MFSDQNVLPNYNRHRILSECPLILFEGRFWLIYLYDVVFGVGVSIRIGV